MMEIGGNWKKIQYLKDLENLMFGGTGGQIDLGKGGRTCTALRKKALGTARQPRAAAGRRASHPACMRIDWIA